VSALRASVPGLATDRWRSWLRRGAVCVLAAICLVPPPSGADVTRDSLIPLAQFPRETVVVETRSARRLEFDAWRADTPRSREQGLMFVPEIGAGQAMIFVYEPPTIVSMWMKNTLLSLDMLFVNRYGCVVKVKPDAKPESLAIISAGAPVALVVELKGGAAAAMGIGAGDRVLRPAAGWPADDRPCLRSP
jgi:uncharacterized protein